MTSDRIVWKDPGPQRRRRPLVDRLDAVRSHEGSWAHIATYDTRGSATSVMSRLRRRMEGSRELCLATRELNDGRIGLFARWACDEASS